MKAYDKTLSGAHCNGFQIAIKKTLTFLLIKIGIPEKLF